MTAIYWMKIALTPLLIIAATLAARRWGPAVGGWLVGLPLTSGPISFFLALEQGPRFAAAAAAATLMGIIALAAFCVAYATTAPQMRWQKGVLFALPVFFAAAALLQTLQWSLMNSALLVCATLILAIRLIPAQKKQALPSNHVWWDIPLRVITATTIVLAITTTASALGPRWSGLLSPFPAFATVMAAFSHQQEGPQAASQLLRGVVTGSFGFAAFFLIVGLALPNAGLTLTYIAACAGALTAQGLTLLLVRANRSAAAQPV